MHATHNSQRAYLLLAYLDTRPRTAHMIRVNNPNEAMISEHRRTTDPIHAGGGETHEEPQGSDESADHTFLFDRTRTNEDAGYALSLRVLGLSNGIHA